MRPARVATADQLEAAIKRYGPVRAPWEMRRRGLMPPIAGATGLAVDASTPAFTSITASAATSAATAAFSPAASSVVVLFISATSGSSATPISVTGITGGGVTWTQIPGAAAQGQPFTGAVFATTEVWYASAPSGWSSQAATVTFNEALANTSGACGLIQPVVFTGAATTQNGAVATPVIRGNPTKAVVTTANGSWVWAAAVTDNGTAAPTIGSNQTDVINGNTCFQAGTGINGGWWVQMQNATTATSGTSVTMNDTAPSANTNFLALEILAATGGSSPIPLPAPTVSTAVNRSLTY